jgi:hypothetical protein
MPKKLNVSSNQRIDLDDFTRAASDYTQESDNFSREQLVLARRSIASGGFRIEISNQATSPGEFTIYNGTAVDKSGNILNNEQSAADARVHTLAGSGLEHYIEVEFVETESDVDSRAFWDPTFPGNNPPGKEFSLNVATRKTPDWQMVQPASTAAFTVTGTVNSNRIPIAVLYTNGSGEIDGFTAVNASTVLEEDVGTLATTLRVLDSSLFPTTGDASVAGTSINITGNDFTNGILTISPAIGVAKQAGDIVVETIVTAAFLPLETDALPDVPSGTESKDQRRSLFKGDEIRGSALSTNPQDAAARSDIQVKSLKDQVDFLAAQIREMKFGDLRTDVEGGLPPTNYAGTRHYDAAGSIAGARTATITIGDGTNSYGDIVGSELSAAIQSAHDALDATTGGSIYVKPGDYTWNGTVTTSLPTSIVFDIGATLVAGTYSGGLSISDDSRLDLFKVPSRSDFRVDVSTPVGNTAGVNINFTDCQIGRLSFDAALPASSLNVVAIATYFATISNSAGLHTLALPNDATSRSSSMLFERCSFSYDTASNGTSYLVYGHISNAKFKDCTFDAAVTTGSAAGFVYTETLLVGNPTNLTFDGCSFIDTDTAEVTRAFTIDALVDLEHITFKDCVFDFNYIASPASIYVLDLNATNGDLRDCLFDGCDFRPMGTNTIPNTSAGTRGRIISAVTNDSSGDKQAVTIVENCKFGIEGTQEGAVSQAPPIDFIDAIYVLGESSFHIRRCSFEQIGRSIVFDNVGAEDMGKPIVEFNYIVCSTGNGAASFGQDCIGIYSYRNSWAERPLIRNNRIYLGGNGSVNTGGTSAGISVFGSIIENNWILCQFESGPNYGIKISDITTSSSSEGRITGNTISAGDSTSTSGAVYGIWMGSNNFFSATDWVISNNSITAATGTSADDIYVVDIEGTYSDSEDVFQFTDNEVHLSINSAGASMTNAYGLFVIAEAANINSNSFFLENLQDGSSCSPYMCFAQGNSLNIIGNNIRIQPFAPGAAWAGSADGIRVFGEDDGTPSFSHPGMINITGNLIENKASTGSSVYVLVGADDDSLRGINITNNLISRYEGASSYDVQIQTDVGTDSPGAFNVSGNTLIERNPPISSDRRAIYVDAVGAVDDARCVIVSNNLISSSNVSYVRSSAAASAAISISGGDGVVCNGNVVNGWVGTGIANRKSIVIWNATDVVCNSNSTEYSGSVGEFNIEVLNCTRVNVSANMCNGGSFDTTDSSDVISTGSNNT